MAATISTCQIRASAWTRRPASTRTAPRDGILRSMATYRVFATTDIGGEALQRLRDKGWELEVYDRFEPPPKSLILEKVRSGIDALITTLRDPIDEEVFAAGKAAKLKVVAQDAVGFDNIDRAAANKHQLPFSHTADVLT